MKRSGFKMKGYDYPGTSPMQDRETVKQYASGEKEVTVKGDPRTAAELNALADKAEKDGNKSAADEMRDKASKKTSEGKRAKSYLDKTP
jgi:hypothetical protein